MRTLLGVTIETVLGPFLFFAALFRALLLFGVMYCLICLALSGQGAVPAVVYFALSCVVTAMMRAARLVAYRTH